MTSPFQYFLVKSFSKKWIIIFIFCENYESYYFVITLVFVKNTVFKKKKKCRFYLVILKKSLYFFNFFRFFFKKNEVGFSGFIRIMKSFFVSLLLCFWKGLCLKRTKRVYSISRFWKKSLLFQFLFRTNELWFSLLIRIMKSILCLIALVFVKNNVFKKKKNIWFYMEILKKYIIFFIFFSNFLSKWKS